MVKQGLTLIIVSWSDSNILCYLLNPIYPMLLKGEEKKTTNGLVDSVK